MKIANTPSPIIAPPPERKKVAQELGFDDIDDYTGPVDGKSHPAHRELLRPLTKALVALEYRTEIEGADKLPTSGPQVYCPTHPSFFDPAVVSTLFKRDVRFIANYQFFDGARGKMMTWGGAFPVDLERGSPRAIKHSLEIVKDGLGFVIFPEGKISERPDQVDPLKKGVGMIAVRGGAEAITPISVHYVKDDKSRWGELAAGVATSLAVGVGATLAAVGDPVLRTVAGAATGALTGLYTGASLLRANTELEKPYDQFPKFFAGIKGGAIGAAAGAVVGGVVAGSSPLGGLVMAGAGTMATAALADAWRTRDVVKVTVGDPLVVKDYVDQYGKREADERINADLHTALGHLKAAASGTPYDENGPKTRE
ncbi:MAG: 1-acyl-sn-glycerol-3-phosphate acyltransferase [Candidatus Eremiobacteraeota bacterium]|nr:1-acyl-sn-glycerol-3-phosphate acyltransferase [Candidatus Eremiobacteraeota bacterium]